MNKCKRCNVWVADDTMVCPLCHTILTEEKSKGQKSGSGFPDSEFEYNGARYVDIDSVADKRFLIQGPGYPDVKKNTRRFRKAGRILLFISLALEMLLAFINYLTFDMSLSSTENIPHCQYEIGNNPPSYNRPVFRCHIKCQIVDKCKQHF